MSTTAGRHVLLLRGINVGRAHRIAMADLRAALARAGHTDVRTVGQSGNVVLTDPRGPAEVAGALETLLREQFTLPVAVVVRTAEEFGEVVAGSPMPEPPDGSRFVVVFLSEAATERPGVAGGPDERAWWSPDGRHLYVWCPEGLHTSPLMKALGRLDGPPATVRNWNTVTAVQRLLRPPAGGIAHPRGRATG